MKFSFQGHHANLKHGSIVIAAITSCTNTSNPSAMLSAGLVAKKACELGLEVSLKSQNEIWMQTFDSDWLDSLTIISIILICCFHVILYQVKRWIKTSLAPGSRVVTEYLIQRFSIYTYSFVFSFQVFHVYLFFKNIPCLYFM